MGAKAVSTKLMSTAVLLALLGASAVSAATFSTTKVELLYADYEERPSGKGFIFTFANATGFTKGDSYFFADVGNAADRDGTDGIHMEWGPRFSFLRIFGDGPREGFFKDFYLIVQFDFDANRFNQRTTTMGGVSADFNLPGWRFFKVHVQYRDDPLFEGSSVQLNLVWSAWFGKNDMFSFEGFLDWTTDEGESASNLLTQPQLMWHANKHIALGIEYQYWNNRLGIDGLTESTPQAIARWTF